MDGLGEFGGARYVVQPADIAAVAMRISAQGASLIPILARDDTKVDTSRGIARDHQVTACHCVRKDMELACLAVGTWAALALVVGVGESIAVAVEIRSGGSSDFYIANRAIAFLSPQVETISPIRLKTANSRYDPYGS